MKIITHNLLPKQKQRKTGLVSNIDLYGYAAELYEELSRIDIINRLKSTPHLGVIKAPNKLKKTRYDYMMLQLHFHQTIKRNLQRQLKYTYNNPINTKEFQHLFSDVYAPKPSIGDILQLLCIAYNIGHFVNTFTSSRAAILLAKDHDFFAHKIIHSSTDPRFSEIAKEIIKNRNYHHFHLINSLLVLEHCSQQLDSVRLTKDLIYIYLSQKNLPDDCKLKYIFDIFKTVRDVSYVAYDLQIAPTPFTLDLWNEQAVCTLFRELLSNFNDRIPARSLMKSIEKLLDDTVYNENSNAICYYKISQRIVNRYLKSIDVESGDYYSSCFLSLDSVFNETYSQKRDYSESGILKLTFPRECAKVSEEFVHILEKTNHISMGYYDRYSGERTILIAVKKKCRNKAKIALHIMRLSVSALRKIPNINHDDYRFLLVAKFFIHNLFGENLVVLKPTIHSSICTLCTRGRSKRIAALDEMIRKSIGTVDETHEIEFIRKCLASDSINDTCITVPGSVLLYPQNDPGRTDYEFDGMAFFPYRKKDQVILFESKNTKGNSGCGKRCLRRKLDGLSFSYDSSQIIKDRHDVYLKVSI